MTEALVNFPNIGKCLYCGAIEDLRREHVVPYSLGGDIVLQNASCAACADITKRFELICARHIFGPLRITLGMRTRRKKERPTTLKVRRKIGDEVEEIRVPIDKYPGAVVAVPILPLSGIRVGRPYVNMPHSLEFLHVRPFDRERDERLLKEFEAEDLGVQYGIDLQAFLRLLAKIAHCFVAAQYGLHNFMPILPSYILGQGVNLLHFIGGVFDPTKVVSVSHVGTGGVGHNTAIAMIPIHGLPYLACRIQLFEFLGLPIYEVIVGYLGPDLLRRVPVQFRPPALS